MVKRKFNAKIYFFTLVAVGLGGIVAGYIMMANSPAFLTARLYLVNNPQIIERLGPIRRARLGLNYSLQYKDSDTAKVQVVLTGQRKSGEAYLTLKAFDGVWTVKSGNLILDKEDPIPLLPQSK